MINIDKTPIGAMKILSCYREIQQILAGRMPAPRTMEFFLSNVCNHACAGCHSKYMHKDKNRFLDFDVMKEVVSDVAELGVEGVEISGGGEPLMYPKIVEAIAFMRSKGLKVGIFSNGSLLTEELSEFLVQNVLFLRVAFDAGTRETYLKIHSHDDFDQVIANLRTLVGFKQSAAVSEPERRLTQPRWGMATVGAKYLVSTKNWHELSQAAELAREIGMDYLQFKALRASKFSLEGDDLARAMEEADKARALSSNGFEVFGSLEKTKPIGRCFLNPIHPVIDANGDMFLCAFFHHRKDTHMIGNVYQKSFPEIWYSERHMEAFKTTKPKECAVFDCPFHEAAVLARGWIVENKKHLEFI
ncbi:MAG: radical SAM protein [Thermoleophilia bacterium]